MIPIKDAADAEFKWNYAGHVANYSDGRENKSLCSDIKEDVFPL